MMVMMMRSKIRTRRQDEANWDGRKICRRRVSSRARRRWWLDDVGGVGQLGGRGSTTVSPVPEHVPECVNGRGDVLPRVPNCLVGCVLVNAPGVHHDVDSPLEPLVAAHLDTFRGCGVYGLGERGSGRGHSICHGFPGGLSCGGDGSLGLGGIDGNAHLRAFGAHAGTRFGDPVVRVRGSGKSSDRDIRAVCLCWAARTVGDLPQAGDGWLFCRGSGCG
mmetsp:Transcript_13610/g.39359  ORF Transcript_13610/g.39359 Transcript_13610/m.39359 type:complete len:219 (+) Transcript_13610:1711-2367(+)